MCDMFTTRCNPWPPRIPCNPSLSNAQDKKFNRACAEAREVQDRRLGKDPITKHRPHDFLHPGWSDDSDEEAAEDRCDDLRPLPASADKLQDCSSEQALLWLRCVACNPLERPKVRPPCIHPLQQCMHAMHAMHSMHSMRIMCRMLRMLLTTVPSPMVSSRKLQFVSM